MEIGVDSDQKTKLTNPSKLTKSNFPNGILGTVFPNFAVGLDQVPRFGLDMVPRFPNPDILDFLFFFHFFVAREQYFDF